MTQETDIKKVAIQGITGCNHYFAAKDYFKNETIETVDCNTFSELADKVVSDEIMGIIAIENTIAGSLLQNYRLIREHRLKVVGEYKLRIKHALVALEGVKMGDIEEINSHPMALMQCEKFLSTIKQVKLVEKDDTAASALWIKENNLRSHAAICPAKAAKLFGMEVIADGIETNKRNFTRFLIVSTEKAKEKYSLPEKEINKSSLVFTLCHKPGSLSHVLSILSYYDMNLTMIQSLPIIGKEWEYQFYINLNFNNYARYRQALKAIKPLVSQMEVLGEYMEDIKK